MKCIYCEENITLEVWGKHSTTCDDRKRVRGEGISRSDLKVDPELSDIPSATADLLQIDIEDMSKDQLLDYLAFEGIEHDPKAKKYQLKKLAKGE